jgi:hypothetical protein
MRYVSQFWTYWRVSVAVFGQQKWRRIRLTSSWAQGESGQAVAIRHKEWTVGGRSSPRKRDLHGLMRPQVTVIILDILASVCRDV